MCVCKIYLIEKCSSVQFTIEMHCRRKPSNKDAGSPLWWYHLSRAWLWKNQDELQHIATGRSMEQEGCMLYSWQVKRREGAGPKSHAPELMGSHSFLSSFSYSSSSTRGRKGMLPPCSSSDLFSPSQNRIRAQVEQQAGLVRGNIGFRALAGCPRINTNDIAPM